ncbi:putative membrane protein [Helicobacter pylori CPY6261]|nr:putative membrane protein [Helicobacter pylori CPY6261]
MNPLFFKLSFFKLSLNSLFWWGFDLFLFADFLLIFQSFLFLNSLF